MDQRIRRGDDSRFREVCKDAVLAEELICFQISDDEIEIVGEMLFVVLDESAIDIVRRAIGDPLEEIGPESFLVHEDSRISSRDIEDLFRYGAILLV